MELTARDIHEKQFHDAWRGYNQEEVDDFLDKIAEVFDLTRRENTALHGRVRELEQALTTSRETEEMLKKTLVSAQQAAEEAIAKAQEKANAIVTEAEERATRVNDETRQRLDTTEADIRRRMLEADRQHTERRRELDATIARLSSFEHELKGRLAAFLEQQVESLRSLTESVPPEVADAPETDAAERVDTDGAASPGGRSPGGAGPEASGEGSRDSSRSVRLDEPEPAASHRRGVRGLFQRDDG
jgi:cell division initiation protein